MCSYACCLQVLHPMKQRITTTVYIYNNCISVVSWRWRIVNLFACHRVAFHTGCWSFIPTSDWGLLIQVSFLPVIYTVYICTLTYVLVSEKIINCKDMWALTIFRYWCGMTSLQHSWVMLMLGWQSCCHASDHSCMKTVGLSSWFRWGARRVLGKYR